MLNTDHRKWPSASDLLTSVPQINVRFKENKLLKDRVLLDERTKKIE